MIWTAISLPVGCSSTSSIWDLRRLYDLVAEIPAQICCGSQVHFPPTQQRGSLVSILIIVKRLGLASGSNRISSAEPYNRYPARHADLIRDFYAQLSDEHSLDNSHVIAATGVAGSGRVGGRDKARMLCRESGRYLHAAVEVKRPCSGHHLLPLDWLAVAVRSPQLTIKF